MHAAHTAAPPSAAPSSSYAPQSQSTCQSFASCGASSPGPGSCVPSTSPVFNQHHRFVNDACYANAETVQSTQPGIYRLNNFYDCSCQPTQTMDIALDHPLQQFKDGVGHVGQKGCLVDTHSAFRNGTDGAKLTNLRGPQTLYERPFLTVPYMGRGVGDPCTELALQEGTSTFERKQCNTLAEVHLPHQYTPLVDCLGSEVQNPVHILPEDNQRDWTRGGYPSRQWVHNKHFDDRCPRTKHCACPQPTPRPSCPSRPRPLSQ